MSRLLQNLINNAAQYGRENGHIWVTLRRAEEDLLLSVRDDGIGIPTDRMDKIWQRFYQVETSRGVGSGTGLGLTMVRQIAALHGGTVTVDSREGEGSCFTLRFPAMQQAEKNSNYCFNILLMIRCYAGYNKNRKGVSNMKNGYFAIAAGLALTALLAGCSPSAQTGRQASYIDMESAKTAALTAAQVDSSDASFTKAELEQDDGMAYYEVRFTANGQDYYYAVDAMTGTVIEAGNASAQQGAAAQGTAAENGRIARTKPSASHLRTRALQRPKSCLLWNLIMTMVLQYTMWNSWPMRTMGMGR